MVNIILSEGADANLSSKNCLTLLLSATSAWIFSCTMDTKQLKHEPKTGETIKQPMIQYLQIITTLPDQNADLNTIDMISKATLRYITYSVDNDPFRALLDASAEPNVQEPSHRRTALHFSTAIGHSSCVDHLLGKGVRPTAQSHKQKIREGVICL